ncbi:MAG: hypothetical protein ACJ8EL_14655 [Rhizomicrobium sp.]|jgi:hypothetical protein
MRAIIALALALSATSALAQAPMSMGKIGDMPMESMAATGILGPAMSRDASGTSWQPDDSLHAGASCDWRRANPSKRHG